MESESLKYEKVLYMYYAPEIGLFESFNIIEGLELASVELLNKEVFDQTTFFHFKPNTSEFYEDSPLTDYIDRGGDDLFVVCKEGVFELDGDRYIHVGDFSKERIITTEVLAVPKDTLVYHHSNIHLVYRGEYEVLSKEEVSLEGKVNHTLFEIKIVNNNQQANVKIGQELKVKIPDYNGVFSVKEVDYLAIEYNERYKKLLDLEK